MSDNSGFIHVKGSNPNGGMTIKYLVCDNPHEVKVSLAYCSPDDMYNPQVGESLCNDRWNKWYLEVDGLENITLPPELNSFKYRLFIVIMNLLYDKTRDSEPTLRSRDIYHALSGINASLDTSKEIIYDRMLMKLLDQTNIYALNQ